MLVVPPLFQDGICKILEREKDIEFVAKASTYIQTIVLAEQTKPDIWFVDTTIAHIDIVRIELIRRKSAATKLLLLVHTLNEEASTNAITLGVYGYLTEGSSTEQFIKAIRAVNQEEIWAKRRIVTRVLTQFSPLRKANPVLNPNLTKREEEIIKFVVQGWSNKQISRQLFISEKTVKTHMGNLFDKLCIRNRFDLAIYFSDKSGFATPKTAENPNSKVRYRTGIH